MNTVFSLFTEFPDITSQPCHHHFQRVILTIYDLPADHDYLQSITFEKALRDRHRWPAF